MAKFALLTALLLMAAAPANADWQFTKWGMSKKQVIRASGNLATPSADGTLSMPYTAGKFTFSVEFDFDSGSKLDTVFLKLRSGTNYSLLDALKEKYGQPDEVDGITTVWRTSRDEIDFSAVEPDGSDATIYYRPRVNASTRGL
jgi:hypothetical protein